MCLLSYRYHACAAWNRLNSSPTAIAPRSILGTRINELVIRSLRLSSKFACKLCCDEPDWRRFHSMTYSVTFIQSHSFTHPAVIDMLDSEFFPSFRVNAEVQVSVNKVIAFTSTRRDVFRDHVSLSAAKGELSAHHRNSISGTRV